MKAKYIAPLAALGLVAASPQWPSIKDKVYELLSGKGQGIEGPIQQASGSGLEQTLGVAYAQSARMVPINEYYQEAKPADEIMPGARIGPYRVVIEGVHWGFLDGKWNELYFNGSGNSIREILSQDKTIDFDKFDNYYKKHGQDFKSVSVHEEGYLTFNTRSKEFKLVVPVSKETVNKLKKIR